MHDKSKKKRKRGLNSMFSTKFPGCVDQGLQADPGRGRGEARGGHEPKPAKARDGRRLFGSKQRTEPVHRGLFRQIE